MSYYIEEMYPLWNGPQNEAKITAYIPKNKSADCAIVILPGGAYCFRAEHEGKGYAEFFAENGITSFVVDYRCRTHQFPIPLMDARRGIQFARYHAEKYAINPNKIAIMGSSAGGHLAALTSTYTKEIAIEHPDEIDDLNYIPNAQILCYPVIKLFGKGITHFDSARNLLGEHYIELAEDLSPNLIANEHTPQAFIWHTFEDSAVNVQNSLEYTIKLRQCSVSTELHIFPHGYHGLGLAKQDDPVSQHVSIWSSLLLRWLKTIDFTSN